ncbi:MAG: tetratricopeptide repeat protein [Flavobacteriales bacterium]|nr:tetratricopeptide repeat protein [Flavobacteriales bacterium]
MKKLILILFISIITQSVFAQINYGTDSATCVTKYQIYRNDYNNKKYEEAIKNWRWVFNECPSYNENTFKNGPRLYYERIKKDKANKLIYLDTIMMIYDARIKHFERREYVLGKKGVDLLKYDPTRFSEAYEMLKVSVDALGNSTGPTVIGSYFKALDNVQKSTEEVTKQDVLDAYIVISEIISYNINNNKKYAKYYEGALTKVEDIFAPYASCDDLIKVFKERLELGIDDISLLKNITKLLDQKDCTENEVFYTAANQLHKLEPTAESAYDMGNMSITKNNYSDAVSYYNQAIKLQEDVDYKASYYLKLSYACQMKGSYSDARSAVTKAAELKPEWGEPYLMLGDIYVSSASSCGSSNLEKGAVYWIAVDMFMKAKSIDNVLAEKANKRISTYSKYFPSKEDCFFNDIEAGSSYKVGCWIGRSTRVRTRD